MEIPERPKTKAEINHKAKVIFHTRFNNDIDILLLITRTFVDSFNHNVVRYIKITADSTLTNTSYTIKQLSTFRISSEIHRNFIA